MVGNLEDRFSHDEAQIVLFLWIAGHQMYPFMDCYQKAAEQEIHVFASNVVYCMYIIIVKFCLNLSGNKNILCMFL